MMPQSPRSILPFVCTAGFAAAVLVGGAVSTAFAAASLTHLGDLPGGEFRSVANAVSDDGSTVVGFSGLGAGQEAFRWMRGSGMVGLGDLSGGDFESSADAVSADGSVVVGYGTRSTSITSREAFRWTSGSGMVGLGHLPGSSFYGWAHGISGDGSVVVGESDHQSFRWTSAGGMVGLDSLDLHGVTGISADGSVIVGAGSLFHIGPEAFRWTSDEGKIELGKLPGGTESAALGASADGATVVGYSRSENGFPFRPSFEAFRWTSNSGMVGLGDLPGGLFESYAVDASGDGSVVVGYGDTDFGAEAFLWTSDGGMQRLWDVLLAQGMVPSADGWTKLEAASGISADGNTIVGWGTRNGNTEAFVAVIPTIVPEPAVGALALLGANSVLLLRRRRQVGVCGGNGLLTRAAASA